MQIAVVKRPYRLHFETGGYFDLDPGDELQGTLSDGLFHFQISRAVYIPTDEKGNLPDGIVFVEKPETTEK